MKQREEIVRRLVAAGIAAPRATAVVVDLAGDPPLGRSAHALGIAEPSRIVEGLGAAMLAARAKRGVVVARDAAVQQAIAGALSAVAAVAAEVVRVPAVWPSTGIDRDLGCRNAWVLDGERLLDLEAAALDRPRAPRRITVAGAVTRPAVIACAVPRTVEELVAAAGGALGEDWVALDGGAWGGRPIDRDDPVRSSLLLVLPASHALVARARTSIDDHLRRVASACEGCRACTESCPVALDGTPLAPHELVWTLAQSLDTGVRIAAANACIGCGVCDAACPSALSPEALVAAVRARLPPSLPRPKRGAPHPDRAGRRMGIDLLLLRAGLADFAAAQ